MHIYTAVCIRAGRALALKVVFRALRVYVGVNLNLWSKLGSDSNHQVTDKLSIVDSSSVAFVSSCTATMESYATRTAYLQYCFAQYS